MPGLFQRLFKLGSSEAHSIIEKLEDPVKMTEQGIRDMKKDLTIAMENFAEVKATSIRAQRDMEKAKNGSLDWERKAMALLQQGQAGKLDQNKSEQLATEALSRKEECNKQLVIAKNSFDTQNQAVLTLQKNIDVLKTTVQQYENELVTLKARAKTAAATSKINRQLAHVDSTGTISMLERMKERVEEEETLALAYGEMAQTSTSVEDEISQALLSQGSSSTGQSEELARLKAKMGLDS